MCPVAEPRKRINARDDAEKELTPPTKPPTRTLPTDPSTVLSTMPPTNPPTNPPPTTLLPTPTDQTKSCTVAESYMAPTQNETQLETTQDPAKQTGVTMHSRYIEPLAHDFNPSRCQQVGRPQRSYPLHDPDRSVAKVHAASDPAGCYTTYPQCAGPRAYFYFYFPSRC